MSEFIEKFYKEVTDEWVTIVIVTNKQTINFSIDNFASCCEKYDVVITNTCHVMDYFIGSRLKNIKWHHGNINKRPGVIEANFDVTTDKGSFVICIFNDHNGYYPHSYKVTGYGFYDEDFL